MMQDGIWKSFVQDILGIDIGIEFHKNSVFMKNEQLAIYLQDLTMDDGFKLIDKELDHV